MTLRMCGNVEVERMRIDNSRSLALQRRRVRHFQIGNTRSEVCSFKMVEMKTRRDGIQSSSRELTLTGQRDTSSILA